MFAAAPVPWILVTLAFIVISVVVSRIPVLSILGWILSTVLMGGIYLGCRAQDRGEPFEFGFLFAGFKQGFGPLAGVGALLVAGEILFIVVLVLIALAYGFSAATSFADFPSRWASLPGAIGALLIVALIAVVYFTVLAMLGYFAPVLVAVYGEPAIPALKGSFTACMRSVLALTVFGLAILGLGILTLFTLGLAMLVLLPVFWAATYCAARDIFET
jgi:hypothetical protein